MLSEIEKKQVKADWKKMEDGVNHHLNALQSYIETFCDDDGDMAVPDVRGNIRKIIMQQVMIENKDTGFFDDLCPFVRASMRKLWNKINNKK